MIRQVLAVAFVLLQCSPALKADITTIDFEGIADGTAVTNQYAGVVFSNATAINSTGSLNDAEFPPHSGISVVFDAGGPISIIFSTQALSFSAFFTYTTALTLTAFDASNNTVDTAASLFADNFVSSGNAPNEFLSLAFAGGISEVTIAGDPAGGSFVMDDVTVTTPNLSAVPEVSSLSFLLTAVAVLYLLTRQIRRVPASPPK